MLLSGLMWSNRSAAFKIANSSSADSVSRPRNRDLPDSNSRRVAELPHERIIGEPTMLHVVRQADQRPWPRANAGAAAVTLWCRGVLWRRWRATVDEDGHYCFAVAL